MTMQSADKASCLRHSNINDSITYVQTFDGQFISLLSRNFSHPPVIPQTSFSHWFLIKIIPVGVFTVQLSYGSWFKPSSTTSLIYKIMCKIEKLTTKLTTSPQRPPWSWDGCYQHQVPFKSLEWIEYLTTWKQCKVPHKGQNFILFTSCRCSFIPISYFEKKPWLMRQVLRQDCTDREDMCIMISMHAGLWIWQSVFKPLLE